MKGWRFRRFKMHKRDVMYSRKPNCYYSKMRKIYNIDSFEDVKNKTIFLKYWRFANRIKQFIHENNTTNRKTRTT